MRVKARRKKKGRETNSNKFKNAFLYKARFNSEWCKEWPFIEPCKEDLMPYSVLFAVRRKAVQAFDFFSLLQEPFERLSETRMNESWKLESPLKISYF